MMFLDIYPHLRFEIFSRLEKKDLLNVSLCSKECYTSIQPLLWHSISTTYRHLLNEPLPPKQLPMCRELTLCDTSAAVHDVQGKIVELLKTCHGLHLLKLKLSIDNSEEIFTSAETLGLISQMENLVGLHLVVVGEGFCDSIKCIISICPKTLKDLNILFKDCVETLSQSPFVNIKWLSVLSTLKIVGVRIPSDVLEDICRLPLKTLALDSGRMDSMRPAFISIKHLSLLQNLEDLSLRGYNLGIEPMQYIATLTRLVSLELTNTTSVLDEDLERHIPSLTCLKKLDISRTKTSDFLFRTLGELEHLTHLNLSHNPVWGDKLFNLSKLPLTHLFLGSNKYTNSGIAAENLKQLHNFSHLQHLDFGPATSSKQVP